MTKLTPDFDAEGYWRARHAKLKGLEATGTLRGPAAWQRWLYQGKLRAYKSALSKVGFSMSGTRTLNFGCGTGYFEDAWEAMGAVTTAGIDVVESVVAELQGRHPQRRYFCGNLASDPSLADMLGTYDFVTAIDVLYHIVSAEQLQRTIDMLLSRTERGGLFMFTDALRDFSPAPHVRFRSLSAWQRLLEDRGARIVHWQPVFVLQNRPGILSRAIPSTAGRFTYWADGILNRLPGAPANNYVLLCRRLD